MKRVLLYFPGFKNTIGGSEFRALSFVSWLQTNCELTFAMNAPADFDVLESQYGIHIDKTKVKIHILGQSVGLYERLMGRLLACPQECELRRIGREYDVCISCHGPRDFGKRGFHFIHMLWSFDYEYACELGEAVPFQVGSCNWLLMKIRKCLRNHVPLFPRTGVALLRDSRQVCIPNSEFVKRRLEERYQTKIADVFYPPTLYACDFAGKVPRDLHVAYLGRVSQEKKVELVFDIVNKARDLTGLDIKLFLAGNVADDEYGREIATKARRLPWVEFVGPKSGGDKDRFLSSHSFAIHALKLEAFGISITEYLKSGIVPIVPKSSAPAEIVNHPSLSYGSVSEAAGILARLLTDLDFLGECRAACARRGEYFLAGNYFCRQSKLLSGILGS